MTQQTWLEERRKKQEFAEAIATLVALLVILGAMSLAYLFESYRAGVFNRCTGSNVGTFEYMMGDFRIEKCAQ